MRVELAGRVVPTVRGPVEAATTDLASHVSTGVVAPAILIVHGTPGDWRQARALANDVAATHLVVLPSRPGYGRTPLRVGRTAAEQAATYTALLDALAVDRAVVVGISGGGPSSYEFARRYPDRCAGLVLCCAVADHLMVPPTGMRALAIAPGAWSVLSTLGRARLRRQLTDANATIADLTQSLSPRELAMLHGGDQVLRDDLLAFGTDRVAALCGVGLRNDTRQFVRAVRRGPVAWPSRASMPTHVLHGSADSVVPLAHAQFYATAIPDATLEVLDGFGHAIPLTARVRLAQVVLSLASPNRSDGQRESLGQHQASGAE